MLVVLHLLTVVDRIDGSPAADESAGQAAETEDDSSSSISVTCIPPSNRQTSAAELRDGWHFSSSSRPAITQLVIGVSASI